MADSTLANDVKMYSQIIANYGAGSSQAKQFRKKMANDTEFLAFADSLDKLNENLNRQRAQRQAVSTGQNSIATGVSQKATCAIWQPPLFLRGGPS